MKGQVRFAGFDDAPFSFQDPTVRVVGVVTRGPQYLEGVLSGMLTTDGDDATEVLANLVLGSRFHPMLAAVFLNGLTFGGFNVVDPEALHERIGTPVVSVIRREPDYARSESALKAHVPDAGRRAEVLRRNRPVAVLNGSFTVWCVARGIDQAQLPELLVRATVRGAIPEPIRLAHVIASGIQRGHSRGPA